MMTALYSVLHMLVDGVCALAMFGWFMEKEQGYLYILLYNFCAFALQMPLGAWLDLRLLRMQRKLYWKVQSTSEEGCLMSGKSCRMSEADCRMSGESCRMSGADCTMTEACRLVSGENREAYRFAVAGVVLTFLGAFTHPVILGMGNALFHVGGGVDVIRQDRAKGWKGKALGIFVAPGALGLFLGKLAADRVILWNITKEAAGLLFPGLLAIGLLVGLYMVIGRVEEKLYEKKLGIGSETGSAKSETGKSGLLKSETGKYETVKSETGRYKAAKSGLMLAGFRKRYMLHRRDFRIIFCCFLVVILRSYVGMAVTFPWKTALGWSFAGVLAVVFGKMAGGILAVWLGRKRVIYFSLGLGAVCYLFGNQPAAGIAAQFLFNMTMPLTLYLLVDTYPKMKGFFFGLLTFGLFLGFVPVYLGLTFPVSGTLTGAVGSLISLGLLYAADREADRENADAAKPVGEAEKKFFEAMEKRAVHDRGRGTVSSVSGRKEQKDRKGVEES